MEGRKRNRDAKFRSLVFHMQFFGLTEMKEDVNRRKVGKGLERRDSPPPPLTVRGIFFISLSHVYFIFLLARKESFKGIHRNDSIVILKSNWISTVSIHS